jgi:hypothetical protein
VVVRNTGDAAGLAHLTFEMPFWTMFVDASLPGTVPSRGGSPVEWTGEVPPGGTAVQAIRLYLRPEVPVDRLLVRGRVRDWALQETHLQIDTSIAPRRYAGGVLLGPIRLTGAGVAVAGWLVAYLLAVIVLSAVMQARARRTRGQPAAGWRLLGASPGALAAGVLLVVFVAIGFLAVFADMAWTDYRALAEYREARCTVLDYRVSQSTRTTTDPSRRRSTFTSFSPVFAVRYQVEGREVVASGFHTGSRLAWNTVASAEATLRQYEPGRQVPCWHDPVAPETVVLLRGFGGSYLFALLPLPVLLLGLWGLRALVRSTGRVVGGQPIA